MALYHYRATDPLGHVVQGHIEAMHELDLEAQLKRMGLILLRARGQHRRMRRVKRMARRDVINFLFQLEMLVRAGVPILAALGDLRDSSEFSAARDLSAGLYEKIEGGATLAQAFAAHVEVFSETVVNLVRSGEVAGQLPDVLGEIVRSLKWQDELSAQTKRLLTYPAVVLLVITGVVFFLMIYLVPQLVTFLTQMGREVPLQTRMLIGLSHIFVNYWWAILSVPVLAFMALATLSAALPRVRYMLHNAALRIPLVGPILKKIILARFADTLALMYRTGIPLVDGLAYCQVVSSNVVIQQAVGRSRERVINGGRLSDSFAADQLFPSLVIRMLRVGESTGALDTALNNVSYFYTRDIDESVGRIQTLIEPALTILMGIILGWIMLAVLSPIYDTIAKMRL